MWNISPAFRDAIRSPVHTMTVKAQVLDTNFNVVVGGTFYDTGRTDGLLVPGIAEDDPRWDSALMGNRRAGFIQNYIVDGSVDVDIARGTRRTMNLSLMNPEAEFTPKSDWGGFFYVNRMVRLWRGILLNGEEELVPIGTFMIDTADVVAERNMSLVVLTGSDLFKMVNKAKFGTPKKWAAGTPIQTVIKEMAQIAGVTRFVIDPLSERTTQRKEIQAAINFERGSIIGDELLSFATAWGLEVFFDQLGRFVSQEIRPIRSPVWDYRPGEDTSLLTAKASYKDELLYNHVIVTGTADEENPVYASAQDNDPSSPTYVGKIGKRTYMYESKFIATVAQAQDTANKLLAQNTKVTEDIELQAICNPAFEGNDVIGVFEPTFTKLNNRLRLQSFTVPLSSSRQTIRLRRMVTV